MYIYYPTTGSSTLSNIKQLPTGPQASTDSLIAGFEDRSNKEDPTAASRAFGIEGNGGNISKSTLRNLQTPGGFTTPTWTSPQELERPHIHGLRWCGWRFLRMLLSLPLLDPVAGSVDPFENDPGDTKGRRLLKYLSVSHSVTGWPCLL